MPKVTAFVGAESASFTYATVPVAPDRTKLVPGTYRPDQSTTGPNAYTSLKQYDGDLNFTANGQVIDGVEVNGRINFNSFKGCTLRNFIAYGTSKRGVDTGILTASGDNFNGGLIEDGLMLGKNGDNPWCSGIRGGAYTMRRVEMNNVPDGFCFTSQIGNVLAEATWVHNGLYAEWDQATGAASQGGNNYNPYAGGYYTHADGVQFHRGKNYTLRGGYFGGARHPLAGPHHKDALTAAYNRAGDDMYNSAFMIKQEVDDSLANRIENVLIEDCWAAGGMATVNMTSGQPSQKFATLTIRRLKIVRFPGSAIDILVPLDSYGKPLLGVWEGVTYEDSGLAVKFSKGA